MKEVVRGRILWCMLRAFGYDLCVLSCYAPDESYSEEVKSNFWGALDRCLTEIGTKKIRRFVCGDFNATIVQEFETKSHEPWLGPVNTK